MEAVGKLERAASPDRAGSPKKDFLVTTSRMKTALAESHLESKSLRKLENELLKTQLSFKNYY